jgi:hypothetical protein
MWKNPLSDLSPERGYRRMKLIAWFCNILAHVKRGEINIILLLVIDSSIMRRRLEELCNPEESEHKQCDENCFE